MADDANPTDAGPAEPQVPTDQAPQGAVIAGLDGQEHDATVVAWAADEAASLGAPLHLQEVVDMGVSLMAGEGYLPMTSLPADVLEGEGTTLAKAAHLARERRPELAITAASTPGSIAGVMVGLSEQAAGVVVGGGGEAGVPFLGSTALSITAHAHCPVVVLPDAITAPSGRVVVGVDGSKHSGVALEYALNYAARHGASVTCVVAWQVEVVDGAVVTTPDTPEWEQVEERYRGVVEKVVANHRDEQSDVPVDIHVRRGTASSALVEAGADAELIVVGSRGRGGFRGMLLGSTSKNLLQKAAVPVAVLRKQD